MTYRKIAAICSGISAAIGGIAWLGVVLGNPRLAGLGEGLVPMAPSTAMLFIAYGTVGLLTARAPGNRRAGRTARAIIASGSAVALPLLLLSLQGIYLEIELLGFRFPSQTTSVPLGHMSPITAFSFLAVSVSFLANLRSKSDKGWQVLASFWIAVALSSGYSMLALAYLLGTPMFYGGYLIPPAATTTLAFMALGLALLFLSPVLTRPDSPGPVKDRHSTSLSLAVVFVFLVAGIVAAGHFYHRNHENRYLEEVGRRLSAITDLKAGELVRWREERLDDAGFFLANGSFSALVKSYLGSPAAGRAGHDLNSWLDRIRNYDRVSLLDRQGRDILSVPASSAPLSTFLTRRALECLASGRVGFADFYRNETNGKIYLSTLIPIFDPSQKGEPIAVLVMRSDPGKLLSPLNGLWQPESSSAETLLVRRDGNDALFLSQLRFHRDSVLNLRVPLGKTRDPAVMATLGKTGVVRGIDYRGAEVLAALRAVPDSPWHLVSQMETREVFKPLQERLWVTVGLIFTLLLCAAAGVGLVWREQRLLFYRRSERENRLNRERLQCLVNVFQYPATSIQDLLDFALSEALSLTESRHGYIYFYDESRKLFSLNSWSPEVMEACQVMESQTEYELDKTGIWGEAVRQARPIIVNDFEAPDPLKRGYPPGHIRLTRFLTIPLFDQGRIVAVVGVANKEEEYDQSDVLQLSLLADAVWKVAERKRAEDDLKQKNVELERFMYTASHDLKSPLVTISTFLAYLGMDIESGDRDRIQQDIDFIRTAADRMGRLLGELLELSRVGRVISNPVQVGSHDLVAEALQLVAGHVSGRGVEVAVGESRVMLYGDRLRLVEIWQNLLENAVKYMGDQTAPRIETGVEQINGETVFFVRDNGIGINPKFQENIFGLFNKLDSGSEGSGLGLALVKRIVEMYAGRIWVESEGEGRGSCFRFTLPRAAKG